jgi:hypothetical protein
MCRDFAVMRVALSDEDPLVNTRGSVSASEGGTASFLSVYMNRGVHKSRVPGHRDE